MRTKKAFYNLLTNVILQLVIIAFGFIVPRIIITKYGSNVNGLISSIASFLAYISLVEAGFGGIVQYLLYKPIARKDEDTINNILAASQRFFSRVSIVFVIYVLALCFIYPLVVGADFDSFFTVSLIIIISISTFAEYYFGLVYKVFLFANQKKYVVSIISALTYVLNIIAIVILSNFDISVQVLKLVSTLLFVIRPILQNVYVRRKYSINLKKGDKKYVIEQKWDAFAQHVASVIHSSTDIVVLTLFRDLAEVSVYSVYAIVISGIKKITSMFYDSISSGFGDIIAKEETGKLSEVFNIAESLFFTFIAIVFSCTLLLITPFVEVYTSGVIDANYYQPLFGYLIVIAELFSTLRFPYSSITLASGHYKQTRNGAIVECATNIVISVALVMKFGLIGVAIGTMVAMFIRTCEFVYHSSKYILKRSCLIPVKKIAVLGVEIAMVVLVSGYLPICANNSYVDWGLNAVKDLLLSCAICLPINIILYRNDFKKFTLLFGKIFKKRIKTK